MMSSVAMETVTMKCSVVGCLRSNKDKPLIFPFPKEGKVRSRWVGATGRGGGARWSPRPEHGVCARHFAPEHRLPDGGGVREDAVPALHLPARGLDAETAALCGVYSLSTVRRLALFTAHRPVLLLQPPPAAHHPAHAAHRAALADLASELHLRPDRAQIKLDNYINVVYERLLQWCRLRAKYELGSEERAEEVAPEWLRRSKEVRAGGGAAGRGAAAALWRGLAANAKVRRSLKPRSLPGGPELGEVWTRGVELAHARLELLTRVGDDEGALHPGARPTFDMEDLVLLLSPEVGAGRGAEGAASGLALTLLFGLVQKYRLEEGERSTRARRWSLATREYRSRHRAASVLLLQRRWHQLKVSALRSPSRPPLHAALLRRFPHLYSRPPLPWHELVAAGDIVEYETHCSPTTVDNEPLEDVAMRFQEPTDDDDVILIERHIDTYEISDEDEDEEEEEEVEVEYNSRSSTSDDVQQQCSDTATSAPAPVTYNGGGDGGDGGDQIDVKLTLSPVVVMREVTSTPGWRGAVRGGRYVDLRRLTLHPPPPPHPARRSIANTIVFEDEDEDDDDDNNDDDDYCPRLTISLPETEGVPERPGTRGTRTRETVTTTVLRKKVQLPDIEQVRIQNRNMLTAEVLPCPAGTGGDGDGGGSTSSVQSGSGSGSGSGSSRYCCWALRARAVDAARVRHAHTTGRVYRPTHASIDMHTSHCKDACACCCAGAERGMAGAALAAEQRALDDTLLRLRPAIDAPPPRPPPPPPPPHVPPAPANRPSKQRNRKRRASSRSPSPPPPSDDLQEWIRQKNLTARFFDLNLKRPAPAARGVSSILKHSKAIPSENVEIRPVTPPPQPPASRSLLPVRVVAMTPATVLEMMSVSEDEEKEEEEEEEVPRAPRPRGRSRLRLDALGDTAQGLKIVAIRRNPATGQRIVVVQPAGEGQPASQPAAVKVVRKAGRAPSESGRLRRILSRPLDPAPAPPPPPPTTIPTDTETMVGRAKSEDSSTLTDSKPALRVTSAPTGDLTATHSDATHNDHKDETNRQGYIISSPALHSDGILTVAAESMAEAPVTVTAAPMSVTAEPLSVTAAPVSVTAALVSLTVEPMTVIAEPMSVSAVSETAAPMSVTAAPMSVIEDPMSVTAAPVSVATELVSVIEDPMTVAAAPMTLTVTPMSKDVVPVAVTAAPVRMSVTAESMSVTAKSMSETAAPMSVPAAPMSVTAAPVGVTPAPMTLTVTPMTKDVVPVTVTAAPARVSVTAGEERRDRATTAGVRAQTARPAPLRNNQLVFQAIPSAFEDFMFKDREVSSGQVSWAGRPLVMCCSRLQAPWAPLLGWYMLTEEESVSGAGDVDYWVFGEAMYRLRSLPAAGAGAGSLRLVHGVPDARSCRALAVRGAPLLALHLSSRRVLRVAARRLGDRLLLRAAATHLAERLAEALNAAPAPFEDAVVHILDDDDGDDDDDDDDDDDQMIISI